MYQEANTLEPSAELRRRIAALDARLAYLRLPAEYRAIPESASITRGDLASLVGLRLEAAARQRRGPPCGDDRSAKSLGVELDHRHGSGGSHRTLREPHVSAQQCHHAQRSRAGGQPHAEDHCGKPACTPQGLAEPAAEDGRRGRQQSALCGRIAFGCRRHPAADRNRSVSTVATCQRGRGHRRDRPHRTSSTTPRNDRAHAGKSAHPHAGDACACLRDPDRLRLLRMGADRLRGGGFDRPARWAHRADVSKPRRALAPGSIRWPTSCSSSRPSSS